MRVLGIDPGTVVTGYGVIDEEDQRLFSSPPADQHFFQAFRLKTS